jgi:hypothetical protein
MIDNNSLALFNELNGRIEVAVNLINNAKETLMDEMAIINKDQAIRQNSIMGMIDKNKDILDNLKGMI